MKGRIILAVKGMLLLAVLLTNRTYAQATDPETPEKAYARLVSVRAMTGQNAPQFTAFKLDGTKLELGSLRGKVVLVCVWDANCMACILEMKSFERLNSRYKNKNLVILALNPDDNLAKIKVFLRNHPLKFQVLYAPQPVFRQAYHADAYPTNYVIDQHGVIKYSAVGYDRNGYNLVDSVIRKCF